MRLASCSRCERHVQPEAQKCPFCGIQLGLAVWWPQVVLATALGMALVGCGDKNGGASLTEGSVTSETSGVTVSGTDTKAESTGVDDLTDGGGYDYDGAPPDWTTTSGDDTTGTSASTQTGGTTGGSEGTTGTGTGTSTDDGTTGTTGADG